MTKPRDNQPDDARLVISDGLSAVGFLRPMGRGFDVFSVTDGGFSYVGKADTRAEALAFLSTPPKRETR
jgi:hypothetical protein